MASKQPMGYKCRIAVVLLVLLASIAALVAVAVIQDTWSSKEYSIEYGIVIDSGSSRSTVFLYEWPGEKQNETGVVTEKENCRVAGNGISEMNVDPEKDAQSWKGFQTCMDKIIKAIPAEKHKTTPYLSGSYCWDETATESSNPAYIVNPCYPEGYNTTIKASSIYDSECTEKPKDYNPDKEFLMVGEPDSEKCRSIVKSIFDFKTCNSTQCSFDGVEQPPVTGDFMAYAGFFFIARALNLVGTSQMDQFNTSLTEFCNTNWTVLRKEKNWISERYLRTYCHGAHYVFTLLTDGYKFEKETWPNINFEKQVRNTSIGWSLGYMLTMSNMIPSEVKYTYPMTNPVFAGLIFLFSALTIITVVLVFIILIRICY
ncbi:Ectonucleoside triphosphate diphosphohydrolase 3 [Collichthys lucidus]|uniref:Ectonucleoside triphosphate diphosphohydrolase 3 n=1 Tax=Collichthys lucidus TaxID=240159 RepID=A0A4U5V5P2_COLLU|nr:Ectonucleoside triphosphate diphosphohydrolase 3 [Collichthys lucidus]